MSVFKIRYVLLILVGLSLQACQFNLGSDIVNAENFITSMGVNISRLTSIDEIPVDNISYVNRGLIEAEPVKGTLLEINDQRYYEFLNLLKAELVKYPSDILVNDVDTIFVAGQILSDEERNTSGFFYSTLQNIYLFPLVFDRPGFKDDTSIHGTIHHEISSILLRKYRFDMIGFMAFNGSELEYWHDEDKILEVQVPSYYATDFLLNEGILTHYAQTSPENDYNGYVEVAFAYPEIMSRFCSSYERIKLKYEFIKKFYLKISPDFQPVFDQISCGDNTQALTKVL
jgi:hypothetical protein